MEAGALLCKVVGEVSQAEKFEHNFSAIEKA